MIHVQNRYILEICIDWI